MRVKRVETEGNIDLRRIMPGKYSKTRRDFIDDYGIKLPTEKEVNLKDDRDLRMLLKPYTVKVYVIGGKMYQYDFLPGWITDLASVPEFFRSVVDNDDRDIIIPAFVHDANFAAHFLPFRESNQIFREMIVRMSGRRWLAFKAWLAVASPIGRIVYYRKGRNKKRVIRERAFVKFRKLTWSGRLKNMLRKAARITE